MNNYETQPSEEKQIKMKTILIVEDNASIGELFVQTISQETPHQALLVPNASTAMSVIKNTTPSLFLLDYHLPDTDGIELFDRLHKTKGLESVPAILMTAGVLEHDIRRRKIIGLSKPVDLYKLLDLIAELLD